MLSKEAMEQLSELIDRIHVRTITHAETTNMLLGEISIHVKQLQMEVLALGQRIEQLEKPRG